MAIRAYIAIKKLEEQLTCSICQERYDDPRTLPCQHFFCQNCLSHLPVEVREEKCFVRCPTCCHRTQLPDSGACGLPPAFFINNLLEVADSFSKLSLKNGPPNQDEPASLCQRHGKPMEVFCESCQELICHHCTFRDHRDHNYDSITILFEKHKEEIEAATKNQDVLTLAQAELQVLNSRAQSLSDHKATVDEAIDAWFEQLHQALEVSRCELKKNTATATQKTLEDVYFHRSTLELAMAEVQNCQELMRKALKTQSPEQILAKKKELMEEFNQARRSLEKVTSLEPSPEGYLVFEKSDLVMDKWRKVGRINGISVPSGFVTTGKGSESAMVGRKASFNLRFRDICRPFPLDLISCQLASSTGSTSCSIASTELGAQYKVSYTADSCGPHHLRIQVGGIEVAGSPITVQVLPSPEMRGQPAHIVRGIQNPCGLAVTKEGTVFVCNEAGNCMVVISNKGEVVRSIQLDHRCCFTGVAVMRDGKHILLVDSDNHHLRKFTLGGKEIAAVGKQGSGKLQFNRPNDLGVHPSTGQVFITEDWNCRVQVLKEDLSFSHVFGKNGTKQGQFLHIGDIAFDSEGMVYVSDMTRKDVQKFTPQGKHILTFGSDVLSNPRPICTDSNDIVYVADFIQHAHSHVFMFTSSGTFISKFFVGSESDVCGLKVDQHGTLVLSDHTHDRIVFY